MHPSATLKAKLSYRKTMNLNEWVDRNLRGLDGTHLPDDRLPTLEKMLLALEPELSIESVQRMRSRKNVVLRIDTTLQDKAKQSYVAKLFVTDSFEKELRVLLESRKHGLGVPEVIGADSGVCLMQFIEGNLLVDRLNQTFDEHLMTMIAEWYHDFHQNLRITKGDPRLRNFIITQNRLVGLDFEEAGQGHWMNDIAGISASILDTDPIFHRKKRRLVWLLLEGYLSFLGEERDERTDTRFVKMISDTLEQTAKYRKDERIMKICQDIRKRGILSD